MERKNPFSELIEFPISFFIALACKSLISVKAIIAALIPDISGFRKAGIICFALLTITLVSWGQVNGDYQTRATGNWNANTTWQVYSGGAWNNCAAGDYPGAATGTGTVNILSGNAVTLNLSPANSIGALTFAPGNIALSSVTFGGNFTLNITGAINYTLPGVNNNGDQTLNIATGTLNCASLTMVTTTDNLRVQSLLLSTGTINVSGDITMATAIQNAITVSGTGIINIGGNFTPGTGTFSGGTGLVNYNGNDQNVAGLTYYDLTGSGSGIKALQGNVTIGRNLAVNAGTLDFGNVVIRTVTVAGDLSGTGTIDMASGGALAHSLTLNGTNNAIASFIPGSGTVIYSRTGVQQIFPGTYYNLTTQTSNQVRTIQGNVTVNNNLTVTTGTFSFGNVAARNVIVNGNLSGAGTIDMASGGSFPHVLNLNGPNNAITGFTAGSGTVIYSGTVAQQIFSGIYNNLNTEISDQVRTIQGNVTINNNLTLTIGTFSFGNILRTINVTGDLSGAGIIDMSGGPVAHILNLGGVNNSIGTLTTAPAAASVVNYNRAGAQNIFSSSNYRNLTVQNGGNKSLQGPISVGGTLTLTGGRVVLGANDLNLTGLAAVGTPSAVNFIVADGTGHLNKVFAAGATGAYLLPVGDAVNYSPVSLTYTANSIQRTIGLRVTDLQHPSDGTINDFISRYWSFTDDQAGTYTLNASFTFIPADLTGAMPTCV
jgi:hypothetical protein